MLSTLISIGYLIKLIIFFEWNLLSLYTTEGSIEKLYFNQCFFRFIVGKEKIDLKIKTNINSLYKKEIENVKKKLILIV